MASPAPVPLAVPAYMVWGVGTGVGKTLASAGLAFALRRLQAGDLVWLLLEYLHAPPARPVIRSSSDLELCFCLGRCPSFTSNRYRPGILKTQMPSSWYALLGLLLQTLVCWSGHCYHCSCLAAGGCGWLQPGSGATRRVSGGAKSIVLRRQRHAMPQLVQGLVCLGQRCEPPLGGGAGRWGWAHG